MPSSRVFRKIHVRESDITIITESEKYIAIALESLHNARNILEKVITEYPEFKTSFTPYFTQNTSEVILQMQRAAQLADVGPMASVAGVLADIMVQEMKRNGAHIAVVENGGEIKIHSQEDIRVGLYSHTTQIKDKIGFLFKGGSEDLGIGTSSGTFGHAFSFGEADTVTVFASSAGVADATATKIANLIHRKEMKQNLERALKIAESLDFIHGVFITCGKFVAKTGTVPPLVFSKQ